jgi:hypothetical protein
MTVRNIVAADVKDPAETSTLLGQVPIMTWGAAPACAMQFREQPRRANDSDSASPKRLDRSRAGLCGRLRSPETSTRPVQTQPGDRPPKRTRPLIRLSHDIGLLLTRRCRPMDAPGAGVFSPRTPKNPK